MTNQNTKLKPGIFRIYKSLGAAQFTLVKPQYDERGYVNRDGSIMLNVAPGNRDKNNPEWDWSKVIKFAISVQDICNLVDQDSRKHRVFHQHGETSKTLEFQPGQGSYAGTYMLNLTATQDQNKQQVSVPLTNGEHAILMRMLVASCSSLLGWV
jgi:hypothetical protein